MFKTALAAGLIGATAVASVILLGDRGGAPEPTQATSVVAIAADYSERAEHAERAKDTDTIQPPAPALAVPDKPEPTSAAPDEPIADTALVIDDALRRAAAELIMVGFRGRSVRDPAVQKVLEAIRSREVGGVIIMDRNIANLRQTKALITALHDANPDELPLLIGVDQEGGAVQRIDAPGRRRRFPSAWRLARSGDMQRVKATYATMSRQLARLGFKLNFGPVVDLRLNPRNPIIARKNRSFGDDPMSVARFARIFVDAHRREGLATTLKHFPGHGSSRGDTHHGFVNITRPFRDVELAPYAKLMATGHADAVMVGHLAHAAFGTKSPTDKRPMPASLSRVALRKVLREELGYDGVIITDDLAMGAIKRYFDFQRTIEASLEAGNDILLMTSGPRGVSSLSRAMHSAILGAVRQGVVDRKTILANAARVRRLKAEIRLRQRTAEARRAAELAKRLAEIERQRNSTKTAQPALKGSVD